MLIWHVGVAIVEPKFFLISLILKTIKCHKKYTVVKKRKGRNSAIGNCLKFEHKKKVNAVVDLAYMNEWMNDEP